MNIPPKYEDVVAQLETDRARVTYYIAQRAQTELRLYAALAREAALREELVSQKNHFIIQLQGAKDGDRLQQRLTVAEQRAEEVEAAFEDSQTNLVAGMATIRKHEKRAGDLETALINVRETLGREYWDQYAGLDETRDILDAALKPAAEGEGS